MRQWVILPTLSPRQTSTRSASSASAPGLRRLFPVSSDDLEDFREALQNLDQRLVVAVHPESSDALGFGFRCGFLGMLHMEIIQERLEREYDLT